MSRYVGVYLCVLCVLAGCVGKKRDFVESNALLPGGENADPSASPALDGGGSSNATAGSLALGSACSTANECASGSCVDGVCCETSCDTVCTRCDAPGREGECTVTPNDAACAVSCPDSTDCRSYGSSAASANCEAAGLCRSVTDCTATDAPAGTPCREGGGTCDGLGECIVPGARRLGEVCSQDSECGEGHCVVASTGAAICCDSACNGLCRTCDATGRCDEAPRDDARCAPVDCPTDDVCRDFPDDITVNLCRSYGTCRNNADCSPNEVRLGAECSCGPTGCTLASGVACSSPAECSTGWCEPTATGALVCCAEACSATGFACSSNGDSCVQCEGGEPLCQDNVASSCSDGALTVEDCGNGCNGETGSCNTPRATGTVCESSGQCASGLCTLDITGTNRCCDVECEATGRVCGTDGSCVCPSTRQELDGTCRLNDGETCAVDGDCASGACVPTVSGPSICCASACAGAFCGSDGSACVECEGASSQCAGNQSQRCQNGDLLQTNCGNGCNPVTGLCTGLLSNGQTCNDSAQCGSTSCAADVGGTMRCCTPNCAASGRVCGVDGACICPDPNDTFIRGQCRSSEGQSCGVDGDCRSNACENTQSVGQICCTGSCNGQICRANGQGCVQCDGGPPTCQGNSSRSCVNNAFITTTCGNGCNVNTGLCNNLIPQGSNGCSQSTQCAGSGSSCQNGRCCEFDCAAAGRVCDGGGFCRCPEGTTPVGSACLLANGQDCDPNRSGQCASDRCDRWFRDDDNDGYGVEESRGVCGNANSPAPVGFALSGGDCCDGDSRVNPGQTSLQAESNNCGDFDYNCNDRIEYTLQAGNESGSFLRCDELPPDSCPFTAFWDSRVPPACGATKGYEACAVVQSPPGTPPRCADVSNPSGAVNQCM